jgi:hypothetical protein
MYLQDFEQYLSAFLSDFSPQNRRAFRSVVRLLSHLMSKTENADDKGTLVAAFTDLLLEEELDALDYLPLVDRLVEDVDTLFSGKTPVRPQGLGTNTFQRCLRRASLAMQCPWDPPTLNPWFKEVGEARSFTARAMAR